MKVEQKDGGFQPVMITLENKKEFDLLWHALNCSFSTTLEEYCELEEPKDGDLRTFTGKLWRELDYIKTDDC